jgi:Subtilase family
MKGFFFDRRNGNNAEPDDAGTAVGLISLPAALLERHGARMLNPEHAVAIPDQPTVRPTVYRARTLLVPGPLLNDAPFIDSVNTVLARVGMKLHTPRPPDDGDLRRVPQQVTEVLQQLPRVAVLKARHPADDTARPVVIDAWVALQALRAAAARAPKQPTFRLRRHAVLDETTVATISLEHLLVGSAISGSPATGSGGGLSGNPDDSTGVTGPGSTDSYQFNGGDTRTPVAVCLEAPERLKAEECAAVYGRRPVVAVLDTGLRAHPWLDVETDGGGYRTDPGGHGFVAIDNDIQEAIRWEGEHAWDAGDRPRQVIRNAWDKPITADPLLGELDTDTGHSTFISGIVRQVAPDAQVLAIRVMHGDGIVNEGDLLCALGLLARRVALAEAGDMSRMVDVVSLSLGYFSEQGYAQFTSALQAVIDLLLDLGVTVVAAAGNYSTSRRFYPAAFAQPPAPVGRVPLISVGALNPNRTTAVFSDGGPWINAWAWGAAMVSTFPVDIQGSRSPEIRMRARPAGGMPAGDPLAIEREALDPDDYRGGFAVWSGTSFSAPLVAAHIAKALLRKKTDPKLGLPLPGNVAARQRALAALESLHWKD